MAEIVIHGSRDCDYTHINVGQPIAPRNLSRVTTRHSDNTHWQLISWQSQIQRGSTSFVEPHLPRREETVAISVGYQHRIDTHHTVGNHDVGSGNRHIADVGHLVGPGDIGSSCNHRHTGPVRIVLIVVIRVDRIYIGRRVSGLLNGDNRCRVAVVAGIRIHVIRNRHRTHISIGIALARSGLTTWVAPEENFRVIRLCAKTQQTEILGDT